MDIEDFGADMLASDGRIVHIRRITGSDAEALRELHLSICEENRYRRFLTLGGFPVDEEIVRLTRPADAKHCALLALHAGRVIGAASYEVTEPGQAEFAVLVADDWHDRGVGTLLLEQLTSQARREGVKELVGEVLQTNTAMLRVAAGLAPDSPARFDPDVTWVRIPTDPDAAGLAAIDRRERVAEQHSLQPLLAPRSVAVIGAGRAMGGVGHETLRGLAAYGFTGTLYAVNPHAVQIAGIACYPSVSAIPEAVDLVVVAVPAAQVAEVLADAGKAGARAAVVLTAGFGEDGEAGRARQRELLRVAREYGMRIVGPNCLGVVNTDPEVRLAATFAAEAPGRAGGLALASQSGAVGIALLDYASHTHVGISTFVSLGNKADVSGNDLLAYWYDDPQTRAVALYLESFGNPRKFGRVARAVAKRKPVLAVKSGRSAEGQRAGASHTAAAAAPDIAVDSLFTQAGVIRVDTLGELLDAARMLVDQPLPRGTRIGLIGNAGGINVLGADAAAAAGLSVPEIAGGNPVDLGAGATPDAMRACLRRMAAGGEVDAIVAVFGATRANDPAGMLEAVAEIADDFPGTPMCAVLVGVQQAPTHLAERRIPVFTLPEQAMQALSHAARYARWRGEPVGTVPALSDADQARARAVVDRALTAAAGWQPWSVAAELLGCYGIPVVSTTLESGLGDVVGAATELGFPVVLKTADPLQVHKSDKGGVRLDLAGPTDVADAYKAMGGGEVLIQPMLRSGVELVVGVVHDPLFGSLVMVGLGGVHTDLLGDRAFQLLPVSDLDARRLWRRLRGAPLLTGYRGGQLCDTAALEDLLLRVGKLAEDFPEVAELDLNPVVSTPDGALALDVKLRLAPAEPETDPLVRALRG